MEKTTGIKAVKRRSVLRAQRRAIIILLAGILLLVGVLAFVKYIVSIYVFSDVDGEKYYIKKVAGKYALTDASGALMDVTKDGYYVTAKASTLLEIDENTGDYNVVAVVDTEEGESLGTSKRLLMYNHTSQDHIQSLEVHNSYGTFTFYRDADDNFQIKGYEGTPYQPTLFSSLAVSCGYTLTIQKIKDPIKDADGKYTEYGLAPQKRVDADGNEYDYTPSWYRMTDTDGHSYSVYIGDEIPSGAGYYVKYTQRDAVYIMSYSVEGNIISMYDPTHPAEDVANILDLPIERFVQPAISYPMQMNNYFDVRTFTLVSREELKLADADENYVMSPIVSFSFWDMDSRFGTFYHSRAYELHYPEDYLVNSNSADATMQAFYTMAISRTVKLGPTEEDIKKYGLDDPYRLIYFVFEGGENLGIEHYIYVSDLTPSGTYYVMSNLYNFIVEIDSSQMLFLDYKLTDWVDSSYFDMNLAWAKEIIVEANGKTYTFRMDNSLSDSMSNPTYSDKAKENTTIASDRMILYAEDSDGNKFASFSSYKITDKSGFTWTITPDKVTAVDANGTRATIRGAKYSTNKYGDEVVVLVGNITGEDGTTVAVNADTVLITDPQGKTTEYSRMGMSIFRKFYQSILYASIEGDVHDGVFGLSDDKIAEFTADPDAKCSVKITIRTTFAKEPEYVYRYYPYSERRSMLTVNGGRGEFCVLRTFTDKIAADAARVMAGEIVDPTSKY